MAEETVLKSDPISSQVTLLEAIQKIALAQVQTIEPGAASEPFDKSRDISQDHWVASIILDTKKAEVFLRVHFSTSIGRQMLANHLKSDPKTFAAASVLDHLKEFCNVIMGRIKGALNPEMDMASITKVFVPNVDPSYDKYTIIPTGTENILEERWWRIHWSHGEIILYARVKSAAGFGEEVLKRLSLEPVIVVDNEGEIEML